MRIGIFPDLETLSNAAGRLFAELADEAVKIRGRFDVVLSGGNTPCRTYELLAGNPFRDRVPWAMIHVFWGDERCVPHDDPRSNYYNAREALLDRVPIPPQQIHPIPYLHEPREAAEHYEALLRATFAGQPPRFDFVFLGLGENGHTASLFPGTKVLQERQRWVAENYIPEQDLYRITLTESIFNESAVAVFLVSGEAKAAVLRDVLEGPRNTTRLPAQLIQLKAGKLHWLADRAAAKLLSRETMKNSETV